MLPVSGSPQTLDQPTRVSGTSLDQTLCFVSHSVLPVAGSTQTTRSPSIGVAGSARMIVYSFPFRTIGVLRPPRSSRFQERLLPAPPSGLIVSGSPVSRLMLLYSGPRQYGQSSGSALTSAPFAD